MQNNKSRKGKKNKPVYHYQLTDGKGKNSMMHLNPNDDRENSLENMRELTENSYHDVFVYYHGKQYLIYSDPGATTIDTDEDYFWFKDYDEMIKAPVFEFKTLEEIIDEIDATY